MKHRHAPCVRVLIGLTLGVVLSACAPGPLSVDDEVNELAAKTAGRTGTAGASLRTPDVEASRSTAAIRVKRPATRNPAAEELTFEAASESRDVAARLAQYAVDGGASSGDATAATRVLGLGESLRVSQDSAREFISAQEQYLLASIALLVERHLWGPRFFNDTTAGLAGNGDDGRFEHALDVINTLRATQRLPSGGSLEARWVWNATEQLREQATGRYTQSSSLALSGQIPLLRGAGSVARESLIQAERDLVYEARSFERFRRGFLVEIAADYFELQNTRANIANQERQLLSLRENAERTAARVRAGRIEAFEQGIAENEVLGAEASLASLREQNILQLERFKIRLGLQPTELVRIAEELLEVPEPEISLDEAATLALELRLDLQNQRDRLDDQRRAVANARNALLPDLNLAGSVVVPTDADERAGGLSFSPDDLRYDLSATFGLPLDRKIERMRLRAELIGLERARREYERSRDDVVVSVRAALRRVDLARFQLRLAEQQVDINRKRRRGQELRADTIGTQVLLDSENALLIAENQRDRAATNLRISVLNYLVESDQLRVGRDGTLERLPGMEPADGS